MQHAESLAREAPSAASTDDPADPPSPDQSRSDRTKTERPRLSDSSSSVSSPDLVDDETRLSTAARRWLREQAARALRLVLPETPAGAAAGHDVRIRLVGDEEMARAHEAYQGIAGTTDVLTFDLRRDPGDPLDVDALLCVDEAARQAAERSIPVERELLLYFVHALLHCAGYDDHDPVESERMHAREDELLMELGVGATYRRDDGGGGGGL